MSDFFIGVIVGFVAFPLVWGALLLLGFAFGPKKGDHNDHH